MCGRRYRKYFCQKCGFVGFLKTKKVVLDKETGRHKHICRKCGSKVYKSCVLLEAVMADYGI